MNMKKEYFCKRFIESDKLVEFLNERVNDVNVVSITYNARSLTPYYVLFYWCYEPKDGLDNYFEITSITNKAKE